MEAQTTDAKARPETPGVFSSIIGRHQLGVSLPRAQRPWADFNTVAILPALIDAYGLQPGLAGEARIGKP